MIKNIVFDMGQVLIKWEPSYIAGNFLRDEDDIALIVRELFRGAEWPMLDSGEMDEEGIIEPICRRLPSRLHAAAAKILRNWQDYMPENPTMPPLIESLYNAGYKIYLLSNISKSIYRVRDKYRFFERFSGLFVSSDYGLVKPDIEIYNAFFNAFSLNSNECFFIDDREENIAAAQKAGMDGFVYSFNTEELIEALKNAGVNI